MTFSLLVARQQDAVFRVFGVDATWSGIEPMVRVRYREADVDPRFQDASIVSTSRMIMVRRSEVDDPAVGDIVTIIDGGAAYRITADPQVDRRGVWHCGVVEA